MPKPRKSRASCISGASILQRVALNHVIDWNYLLSSFVRLMVNEGSREAEGSIYDAQADAEHSLDQWQTWKVGLAGIMSRSSVFLERIQRKDLNHGRRASNW